MKVEAFIFNGIGVFCIIAAAVYGIWDHIKNSGEFDAENLTLEWIGNLPGLGDAGDRLYGTLPE